MQTFLTIAIILAVIGAVVALVRGIIIFLRTSHQDVHGGGPSVSGLKQNKMMRMRIMFQAIAVILVILILLLARGG
jgi:hypothetical protein